MNDQLKHVLDDCQARLEPSIQDRVRSGHIAAIRGENNCRPPVLLRIEHDPCVSQPFTIQEAVDDPAKMLANELCGGFTPIRSWLDIADDRPLQIRPNFGIGLVASVFGADIEVVDDNPPWVHSLCKDADRISDVIKRTLDDIDVAQCCTYGWLPRVVETIDFYRETLDKYPAVRDSVAIAMPDLQGPLDTAAMLWGSALFESLVSEPDLASRLLAMIADVMVRVHGCLRKRIGSEHLPENFSHQHGGIVGGNILLRCDSGLMLSPRMYKDMILPCDLSVLENVGGGSYHSCGDWTANMPLVMNQPLVSSMDLGLNQSTLYDIDAVYEQARTYNTHLHLVTVTAEQIISGQARRRFPAGVTLSCTVPDVETARRVLDAIA